MNAFTRRSGVFAIVGFATVLIAGAIAVWLIPGETPEPVASASSTTQVMTSTTMTSVTTPPTASTTTRPYSPTADDLVGEYRGKVFRNDEPGTPETFHLTVLGIMKEGDALVGRIDHGPVTAPSLERYGSVSMPLAVVVEGNTVRFHWDPSVGSYEDTTFAKCEWETWDMTFEIQGRGDRLVLLEGFVSGTLPGDSDVTEWWAGCPAEERAMTRSTLVRR